MTKTVAPLETCSGCGKKIPAWKTPSLIGNRVYCEICYADEMVKQNEARAHDLRGMNIPDLPEFLWAAITGFLLCLSGAGYLIFSLVALLQAIQADKETYSHAELAAKIGRNTNEAFIAGLILLGFGYLVLMVRKIATRAK